MNNKHNYHLVYFDDTYFLFYFISICLHEFSIFQYWNKISRKSKLVNIKNFKNNNYIFKY